jgi:hypothetical protein
MSIDVAVPAAAFSKPHDPLTHVLARQAVSTPGHSAGSLPHPSLLLEEPAWLLDAPVLVAALLGAGVLAPWLDAAWLEAPALLARTLLEEEATMPEDPPLSVPPLDDELLLLVLPASVGHPTNTHGAHAASNARLSLFTVISICSVLENFWHRHRGKSLSGHVGRGRGQRRDRLRMRSRGPPLHKGVKPSQPPQNWGAAVRSGTGRVAAQDKGGKEVGNQRVRHG